MTFKLVNVPILVMLGCDAVAKVPVIKPLLAVMLTAVNVPLTPNVVSVPTEVIFGCAAVVTVPAVVALLTVPVTLAPATELAVLAVPE